jgi:nucleotide sugar dehydrogenase
MKIGLIGAGRLGICLALLIERAGFDVIASDVREDYVERLQNKVIFTNEPYVQDYLSQSKNIEFTTDNQKLIDESDIIFTLVQTPSLEDGSYDVSAVWKVIQDLQNSNTEGKSFVVGCTTNPGDCDEFQKALGIDVYYNPEFIAQGSIIKDLQNADMVLLGGKGKHTDVLTQIYYGIQGPKKEPSIHLMSAKAAELTKIAVNCFLTTKISYANMIGEVLALSKLDGEIDTVLNAIGSDSRIGTKYLNFGFGFGGPCFPRDNRAFAAHAKSVGVQHNIGFTVDAFNEEHAEFIKEYFMHKNKKHLPFAFKYLTYKPGIDILTESQQYRLCLDLLDEGFDVYCMDDAIIHLCDDRIIFEEPTEEVYWINL